MWYDTEAQFTPQVSRPRFNSNQALLLVQKFKLAPKGFTLGLKAEIEKKSFQSAPSYKKMLNFMAL